MRASTVVFKRVWVNGLNYSKICLFSMLRRKEAVALRAATLTVMSWSYMLFSKIV